MVYLGASCTTHPGDEKTLVLGPSSYWYVYKTFPFIQSGKITRAFFQNARSAGLSYDKVVLHKAGDAWACYAYSKKDIERAMLGAREARVVFAKELSGFECIDIGDGKYLHFISGMPIEQLEPKGSVVSLEAASKGVRGSLVKLGGLSPMEAGIGALALVVMVLSLWGGARELGVLKEEAKSYSSNHYVQASLTKELQKVQEEQGKIRQFFNKLGGEAVSIQCQGGDCEAR